MFKEKALTGFPQKLWNKNFQKEDIQIDF
jgi:hypothetical protein